ncbi:SpoIIE family protein phosphatase [Nonomuraea gerenzanensis]|uniref:protein-serine/threonine phosphatase n=1 Tax=Nonomuraea gerenzanensis TaxID=93944 RepID=A0A1M4E975_9ACTN|nr:SpoIIE family protein phosphatase [Nonomuraea gerenzanensis]UBU17511.1 SpoIIE family protein phosphatase [Nonomuraea gerenzanensis]SBO95268.1 Serine phosphatase RsbU, regulator of sigma subunit [Nonomuraea gerenzanensis]
MGWTEPSGLDDLLIEAVFSAGAHIGSVYVLDGTRQVLGMEATIGLPATVARTWARVRTNECVPISVAVRERRLLWLQDRMALARGFPAAALALPYDFAMAFAPLCSGGAVWGGFVLGWPTGGEAALTSGRTRLIEDVCARIGRLLHRASERGRPVVPGPLPRILDQVHALRPGQPAGLTALTCLNCLPEGHLYLDAQARVTLVTAQAAEILDADPSQLIGRRLCKALPWLDDPLYEDHYRGAVVSHRVTRFTARHSDGRLLSVECFPGVPGVTLRIVPAAAGHEAGSSDAEGRPPLLGLHEMLHLATCLAQAVTAQDVVDLVADHVLPVTGAQALAILSWESGRMRVVASRGYSPEGIATFNGRPVVHAVPWVPGYQWDRPSFYGTWREFQRTFPTAVQVDGMSAWALLPLSAAGQSIGTCVLGYDRPRRFGEAERAMLTALGGLIAQAFERAWLYDNKHQLAESLQARLLPADLPEIPGLELAARYLPTTPGMDIGGDFYDVIRLDDTTAAAVIGDVQGHDMTAAALMGQVRTAIRATASTTATCGEVLAHANRLMTELAPDRFTSCLYIKLDLAARTVCLAGAGHPPPLLSIPGAPTRVLDEVTGLLLGIDPAAEYGTTVLPLPPGSVLALYTDGLVEQRGLDLGDAIASLAARFTPAPDRPLHELAEALVQPATEHQRTDDTAVLLLRLEDGR